MSTRKEPYYQTVSGITIAGGFHEGVFREGLTYVPKNGDFFIVTYPKCGTTWTQMIVYLIQTKGKPPASVPEFLQAMPFLEITGLECVEGDNRPYAIKSHLAFERIPYSRLAKYLCIARDPKDVVVSYFHHVATSSYIFDGGEFDVVFDMFMEGKTEFGNYFDHVLGWYEHRNDPNVLFLTYEELKNNTRASVLKIARFMGDSYFEVMDKEPEVFENVLKYSTIQEMAKTFNAHAEKTYGSTKEDIDAMPMAFGIKHFRKFALDHHTTESKILKPVRTGVVGNWKQVLTPEQTQRIDTMMAEKFSETDLYEMWKNV